jgi:hypothetical protein
MVTTLHHDKMDEGEVEIFQDTVSLRVDGKGLKRTRLFTLQLDCKDVVPVNHLSFLNGDNTVSFDQGSLASTAATEIARIAQVPELSKLGGSHPDTRGCYGFAVSART